jgi:hypothetical protein
MTLPCVRAAEGISMGSFVLVALTLGSAPEFLSCQSTDSGAQAVVRYSPALPVTQGTIVIPPTCPLPGALYTQWIPPASGYWVALSNLMLPNVAPAWGSSTDGLHFALPPAAAPGE